MLCFMLRFCIPDMCKNLGNCKKVQNRKTQKCSCDENSTKCDENDTKILYFVLSFVYQIKHKVAKIHHIQHCASLTRHKALYLLWQIRLTAQNNRSIILH